MTKLSTIGSMAVPLAGTEKFLGLQSGADAMGSADQLADFSARNPVVVMSATGNVTGTAVGAVTNIPVARRVVVVDTAGITATLQTTLFVVGQKVKFVNVSSGSFTLAVPGGVNSATITSLTIAKDTEIELTLYQIGTAPSWVAPIIDYIDLGANGLYCSNNAGTQAEARWNGFPLGFVIGNVLGDGPRTGVPILWPSRVAQSNGPYPGKFLLKTGATGSTCNVQVMKNGAAIDGFATAQAATFAGAQISSAEVFALGDLVSVLLSGTASLVADASSFKGLLVYAALTRTGS